MITFVSKFPWQRFLNCMNWQHRMKKRMNGKLVENNRGLL